MPCSGHRRIIVDMMTNALTDKAHGTHHHHPVDVVKLFITGCVVAAVVTILAIVRSGGPTVVPAGPQDVPPASIEVLSEMNQPKQPIVAQPQAEPMETTPPASLEVLAAMNGD